MLTKGDKILIILVAIICILALFFIKNQLNIEKSKQVVIKVDGKLYEKVDLRPKMSLKKIEVISDFGYNLVEVDDLGAKVVEANCPDKLDIKFGKITSVGEIIVCLPNRMTVEIIGGNEHQEVDIISR